MASSFLVKIALIEHFHYKLIFHCNIGIHSYFKIKTCECTCTNNW